MREPFDFLVLGGGPSGSAVATLLANAGARVALLEKSDFSGCRAGEHAPPKLRDALAALGCDAAAFHGVLSDSPGIRSQWATDLPVLRAYSGAEGPPGLNLLRHEFDRRLFEHAMSRGVRGFCLARTSTLVRDRDGWQITTENESTRAELVAKIVIDASGRRSHVARLLEQPAMHEGNLTATVAWLPPSHSERRAPPWLVVEACESGWCSQTPLPDGRRVVALYTSPRSAAALGRNPTEQWRAGVSQTALVALPPEDEPPELVARYPVFPRRLASAHGDDWFAVGEAALAFDPISGQGISFALETAFRAAEMACASAGLAKLGPLYDEALRTRWVDHCARRLDVYREAAPRFPGAVFWSEFADG